jgi:hypothetical protein
MLVTGHFEAIARRSLFRVLYCSLPCYRYFCAVQIKNFSATIRKNKKLFIGQNQLTIHNWKKSFEKRKAFHDNLIGIIVHGNMVLVAHPQYYHAQNWSKLGMDLSAFNLGAAKEKIISELITKSAVGRFNN